MIVVAGHLCLDVIPAMPSGSELAPGALVEVGPASFTPGGAVANVGLALTRLGLEPVLLGRIGADPFGELLRTLLGESGTGGGPSPTVALTGAPGESSSYTLVISPPGRDRTFLHHAGCNDTFSPELLAADRWPAAELLHFGYPPLMAGVYRDGGGALASAFEGLRRNGVTVSLDMAMPDPGGPSGRVDWVSFLTRVLPRVDLFLPSWEEIRYMLEPGRPAAEPTRQRLSALAERLLALGAAVVGIKLGERGLYLRTAPAARLRNAGRLTPPADWAERELLSPNFRVEARGTTGAGDVTIAGLLAALAQRLPIEQAVSVASAAGACSVEGVDAVGGVPAWQEIRRRMAEGWPRVAVGGTDTGGVRAADEGAAGGTGQAAGAAGGRGSGKEADLLGPGVPGEWRLEPASGVLLGPLDRGGSR